MDAFESLVAELFSQEGYWVRQGVYVNLEKSDKRMIGRFSSPRWQIDVVAYNPQKNELLIIECKSYLDSSGVNTAAFNGKNKKAAARFKLFNDKKLYKTISSKLAAQLLKDGLIHQNPTIILALVAGKITSKNHHKSLLEIFKKNGWLLLDKEQLCEKIRKMANSPYQNNAAVMVAKLLLH